MPNYVMSVRGLGKNYRLDHAIQHTTLRDKIASGIKSLVSSIGRPKDDARKDVDRKKEVFWALQEVSFDIQQGDVVGIVGRNGAGKSTLLKILSQITAPSTGEIRLRGRVASLLEVGTGFHQELTGRENIYLNGAILGMSQAEIRSKFDEIVAFSEVERFLDTPVKRYSSGMYVRLAFAVAAHLEPEILLVDEVLAVGDVPFQKKCLGKMGEVARAGRTVVFVSHNMAAVTQLCRKAIWLQAGRLVEMGESDAVVQRFMRRYSEHTGEKKWSYPGDAPGDNLVRLIGASIQQNGLPTAVIDINHPSQIEFEFLVLEECRNLVSGINLINSEEVCLLTHLDWRSNHMKPGRYRKRVNLPAQLLAEGPVSVSMQLSFYEPSIRGAIVSHALEFEAVDSDHPQAIRGLHTGRWPGVLRLPLDWEDATPVKT
jgi:lipopolysaccharide transport system ATP-binding protein